MRGVVAYKLLAYKKLSVANQYPGFSTSKLANVEDFFKCKYPVDTGRKLNVHKTFRRRPGPLLNVTCTFNVRHLSTGYIF